MTWQYGMNRQVHVRMCVVCRNVKHHYVLWWVGWKVLGVDLFWKTCFFWAVTIIHVHFNKHICSRSVHDLHSMITISLHINYCSYQSQQSWRQKAVLGWTNASTQIKLTIPHSPLREVDILKVVLQVYIGVASTDFYMSLFYFSPFYYLVSFLLLL